MEKTRPQNIDIWPIGGHFMSMTYIWQSCQKILKITKSHSFLEISPPLGYGPKMIISQYYIWVTSLKNAPLYFLEGGAESAPPRWEVGLSTVNKHLGVLLSKIKVIIPTYRDFISTISTIFNNIIDNNKSRNFIQIFLRLILN